MRDVHGSNVDAAWKHACKALTVGVGLEASPFRVLISAPSNGCVGRTIFDSARMSSEGGMRLVNDADPAIVYAQTAPGQTLRASRSGAAVVVTDEWSRRVVYAGRDAVRVVPVQPWDPISISEKGLSYRGDLWLRTAGGSLTVVNVVSPDDYMRGVLPGEMLPFWEIEALRAQAVTARTYAAWKQSSASDREWDVRDDVSDQCYGGHSAETERTNAAVGSTAGQFLFYDGEPIRAMFSSANGGATENPGCVFNAIRVGDTWGCAEGWSYLSSVPDPAELAAYDKRGANPYAELWAEHFSGGAFQFSGDTRIRAHTARVQLVSDPNSGVDAPETDGPSTSTATSSCAARSVSRARWCGRRRSSAWLALARVSRRRSRPRPCSRKPGGTSACTHGQLRRCERAPRACGTPPRRDARPEPPQRPHRNRRCGSRAQRTRPVTSSLSDRSSMRHSVVSC